MELEDAEYDALSARQLQSFSRQHHSKWVPGRICGCGFRGLVESILGRRFGAVVKIKSNCREQLSRSRAIVESSCHDQEPLSSASGH